jgi:hypothetical protein
MLDVSWNMVSLYISCLGRHCHELVKFLIVLEFLCSEHLEICDYFQIHLLEEFDVYLVLA